MSEANETINVKLCRRYEVVHREEVYRFPDWYGQWTIRYYAIVDKEESKDAMCRSDEIITFTYSKNSKKDMEIRALKICAILNEPLSCYTDDEVRQIFHD